MVAPSPAPALHGRHAKEVAQYCASLPLRPKPPTDQAAVDQRKNIRSNCSFTHPAMIEYDDPPRAAYRGHFAGIEGSNLARSPVARGAPNRPDPGRRLDADVDRRRWRFQFFGRSSEQLKDAP